MSSRQEEKEKRKRERLERERAAQADAKRKRVLQVVGGTVAAAALVVVVVIALASGDGSGRAGEAVVKTAASTAGCVYKTFPSEGSGHLPDKRNAADYKTNPPTSGDHNPNPAQDGMYAADSEPAIENWVHTLEHGRAILMYKPGAQPKTVTALQRLFDEPVLGKGKGYHVLLMQNNTKMPFQAAAVAWQHYVGCNDVSPASLTAMRQFRDRFVDHGPELVP